MDVLGRDMLKHAHPRRQISAVVVRSLQNKYIYGRPREYHNKIMQPIPSTKRKRKLLRTEITLQINDSRKISSLFPKRGNQSAKAYI